MKQPRQSGFARIVPTIDEVTFGKGRSTAPLKLTIVAEVSEVINFGEHDSNGLQGSKQLLHQAFLVGLEGFELLGFGGDQGVEVAEAGGDTLLLWQPRPRQLERTESRTAKMGY